jgi:hypothetical protein
MSKEENDAGTYAEYGPPLLMEYRMFLITKEIKLDGTMNYCAWCGSL